MSDGLPVNIVVGTSDELQPRDTQSASNAASTSQAADSAAASADAAWKFSRVAQAAAGESTGAVSDAEAFAIAAAEAARNAAIAANIYPTLADAQAAIDAGTIPLNALFNVAVPAGAAPPRLADQYQNVAGVAVATGQTVANGEVVDEAINAASEINNDLASTFVTMYQYNGDLNVSVYHSDSEGRLIHWIDHNVNKLFFRGKAMQEELDEETFNSIQTPILQPKFDGMYRYNGELNVTVYHADIDGRLIHWIDHNTNKLMFRGKEVGSSSPFISPLATIDAIGDSLTNGQPGVTPWRVQIADLISARTIINYGIGGQTSGMIASRLGIQRPLVTVDGNTIPSSGFVNIIACKILSQTAGLVDERPLTTQGYQLMTGTLAGVPGVFSRIGGSGSDANNFKFTRSSAGDAVRCWPNTPFILDDNGMAFHTKVIGIGRNDCSGLTTVNYNERMLNLKYRIDRFVARIETAEQRYFILTPPTAEGEVFGTIFSDFIIEYENYVQDKYGDRVLNQRTFSFQFTDGGVLDEGFIAQGIPPASMRVPGDTLHFNTVMHGHIAEWLASQINSRGW